MKRIAIIALALVPVTAHAADFVKGPWLQRVTTDSITVMWEASAEEASTVSYGLTRTYEIGTVDASVETVNGVPVYTARITGLEEDTIYHYRASSGATETLDATFKTALPAGTTGFRFYAVGDSRSNPSVWGTIARQIHDDMAEHPQHHQSFILNTGDIAEDGDLYDDWDQCWPPALVMVRELPMYVSFGNHEEGGDTADGFLYGYFDFPYGESGSTDEKWYSFVYGNLHSSVIALYAAEGYRSGSQYDWLAADLDGAQNDALTDWTVASMHFTPWSLGNHDEADASSVREHLHPVLRDEEVDLAFGGHNHIYARYAPVDGVTYITTGGGGAGLHTDTYTGWSGATLEFQAGVHHHCVIDVEEDVLAIRVIDLEGNMIDWVTLGGTDTDRPPLADAGPDQTTTTGTEVTLDGSGSVDPEASGLTYAWTQVSGPAASLTGADTVNPVFTPDSSGRHLFELRVSDGTNDSAPDFTAVDVHAGVLTFTPVADTFINRDSPSTSYGSSAALQLDLGPDYNPDDTQHAYLRFDVTGIDGYVSSARLRLWCLNSGSQVQIYTSSDTTWAEDAPTWEAPLPEDGPLCGTLDSPTEAAWAVADVTPAITADGPVTLVLLPTGTDGADFSTKEGTDAPELIVTYVDEENPDPTCSISADRTAILEGESIGFTAVASAATGHSITSREWDFDHDSFTFETGATGETVSHTFPDAGTFTVALRVTDDEGRTCFSTIRIDVTAEEPPDDSSKGCGCSLVW